MRKKIPSVNKGKLGFDGQKCAHTASSPLEIRQVFPAGLSLSGHISARQNCFAPASDGFSSDFWFSSRRRADARQGEKDKKRRKGALAGVFALVNRWFLHRSANAVKVGADSVPIRCQFGDGFRCRFSAVFTPDTPKCKWPWPRPGGRFFPGCGAWSLGRWRRRRDPGSAGAIPSRPQRPGHSPGRT